MGFDVTELGRRMADACIRDMRANFRGDVWGNNGPGVITRTLQKLCSTKYVSTIIWYLYDNLIRWKVLFFYDGNEIN